jgi:hypothetical protein
MVAGPVDEAVSPGGRRTRRRQVPCLAAINLVSGPAFAAVPFVWRQSELLAVDDYSLLTLRSGGRTFHVETGYLMPAPHSTFDMRFTSKARDHYLIAAGPQDVEVVGHDGTVEHLRAHTTNVPHYSVFVRDVLHRVREGEPPVAPPSDAAAAMELVQEAYCLAYGKADGFGGVGYG